MIRLAYLIAGWAALALGVIGAFVPLMPTVVFLILAAFCFARSSPRLEAWLLDHPHAGPHIRTWRATGAISRRGKIAATIAFALSAAVGIATLTLPYAALPVLVALIGGTWIWTRPEP